MAAIAQSKYATQEEIVQLSQILEQATLEIKKLKKLNKSLQAQVATLQEKWDEWENEDGSDSDEEGSEEEDNDEDNSEYQNYDLVRKFESKEDLRDMLAKRGVASVSFPIGNDLTRTIHFDPKTSVGRAIKVVEDFLQKPVTKVHYERLAGSGKMSMTYEQCRHHKVVCGYLLGMNVLSSFTLAEGKLTLIFKPSSK
jgi:hypothetical protein